uniref:Uncharacterized protein n=1 Tax=Cucumis melo TaxID=3656 RepID=A0A9I9E4M0_CUCME
MIGTNTKTKGGFSLVPNNPNSKPFESLGLKYKTSKQINPQGSQLKSLIRPIARNFRWLQKET